MGDQTGTGTRLVLHELHYGSLPEPERRALLDALGHSDCVPREQAAEVADHDCAEAHQHVAGEAVARAERAERERDRLREVLSRINWVGRDALSAGADADAEPEPWEHLRVPYEGDTATAGELTVATEHPDGTCAFCDQRRDTDAEPSCDADDEPVRVLTGIDAERDARKAAEARAEAAEARLDEAYRHGREHESYDRDGDAIDCLHDDGHSRAREAIVSAVCERFGGGTPLLDSDIHVGQLATTAIDAALASGGVLTRDHLERSAEHAEGLHDRAVDAERRLYAEQARVRRLEAVLRAIRAALEGADRA